MYISKFVRISPFPRVFATFTGQRYNNYLERARRAGGGLHLISTMADQRQRMSAKEEFAAMKKKKAEEAAAAEEAEAERKKGLPGGVVGGIGHIGGDGRSPLARGTSGAGFDGQQRRSVREKKEFDRRMTSIETKWYKDAVLRQGWSPKKKELYMAVKRFATIIQVGETRKRLDGIPVYKEWVGKMDEKQKQAEKKRSTAIARFAVGDAVAGAVSDLTNEMLHGVSVDTPPKKRMEAVMTNAKSRGLTLPQIFGFFLGRTLDEAMQLEMTQELEEELYRTELTKTQFNEGLRRLDKHLFDVSEAEMDYLMGTFDEDGSGTISLTEFRDWCFCIPSLTWKTASKTYEEDQLALLKSVPLLADLKIGVLRRLLSAMTIEFYNPGDYVMKQGDTEDRSLFVIIGGKAKATRNDYDAAGKSTGEKEVGALPTGAFFGESALLNEEPRSANVIAASKLKCAKLGQKIYERILEDIAETVRMQSEARQGTIIVSEMVDIYSGMWKPKLKGSERFSVHIALSPALLDEGAVVVLAYNLAKHVRSPSLFIDAGGARSLTSAMEMRAAQKVEAKREMAAASKLGKQVERGTQGLSGVASKASIKTLEMQKKVENECIAKALLMRFLPSPDGSLLCHLLRGDREDTPFYVKENPGFPQELFDSEHKKMGWDPDAAEADDTDDDEIRDAAVAQEEEADGPIADGRHAPQ